MVEVLEDNGGVLFPKVGVLGDKGEFCPTD